MKEVELHKVEYYCQYCSDLHYLKMVSKCSIIKTLKTLFRIHEFISEATITLRYPVYFTVINW